MKYRVVGLQQTLGRTYWTGSSWSTTELDGKPYSQRYAKLLMKKLKVKYGDRFVNYGIKPVNDQ